MAPFDKSRSSYSSSVATTFIANLWCSTQCHDITTMQYKSVLHGCIARMCSCAYDTFTAEANDSPLCDWQHGILQANPWFAGCVIRIIK